MKNLIAVLVLVLSVFTVNAQKNKVRVVTYTNGPVMLESIEQPDRLNSDVVFDNKVEFIIDFEKMEFTETDRGITKTYKIEKKFKVFESDKYMSRAFLVNGTVITFTLHKSEPGKDNYYSTVQKTIEYMEYQHEGRPWYVQMYFAGKDVYAE